MSDKNIYNNNNITDTIPDGNYPTKETINTNPYIHNNYQENLQYQNSSINNEANLDDNIDNSVNSEYLLTKLIKPKTENNTQEKPRQDFSNNTIPNGQPQSVNTNSVYSNGYYNSQGVHYQNPYTAPQPNGSIPQQNQNQYQYPNQNPYVNQNQYANANQYPHQNNVNYPNPQNNIPGYMPYITPIKKVFDRIDKIFALLAILLGYLFIQATFLSSWCLGIGTSIMFLVGHIAGYVYIKKRGFQLDKHHKIISAVLIFLSLSFTVYSNPMAVTANFLFLILGNAYWIYSAGIAPDKRKGYIREICDSLFVSPFNNFGAVFSCLFGKNKAQKSGNGKWIILGLCIAIPIVAIVSSLLMGDELFKAMFSVIFDEFLVKIVNHLWYAIIGLPIALIVFSVWYTKHFNTNVNTNKNTVANHKDYHIAPPALMYSIVIPVCVVYFLYLISQVFYFISFIADNLLPEGFTIVDYARSGFFELCVVAVINLIIIALLIILTKQKQGETEKGVKIITMIMCGFTIIMIFTALYKMFTYIGAHGYTAMRINTSAFMIFLLLVFALIIAKQVHNKVKLFPAVVALLMVFICGYTLADTDSFIASENIRRFKLGEIDWMGNSLVRRLDDSAYKHIVPFAADKNNGLSKDEQRELENIINYRYLFYEEYSMSFNINRFVVNNMINEYGFGESYDRYSYSHNNSNDYHYEDNYNQNNEYY